MTEIQTVQADVKVGLTWLQKHERIVLSVIAAVVLLFGTNKYLSVVAAHDQQQATIAQQQLTAQQSVNAQLAAQAQQDRTQYQAVVAALTQQNAQLSAAQSNRTIVLQQQQAADKTLPPPALAERWAQLAGLNPVEVAATAAGVTVTPAAAVATVTKLEEIPVLAANLADTQTQYKNSRAELAQADTVIADQDKQIDGLHTELTDQKKADATELKAVKASERRGKLHAFFYGVGVGAGAVSALVIHALL